MTGSTLSFEYRKALATHVATFGNTIVAQAFAWHQGESADQLFENVLFNCAVEFSRLSQLYHNERIIHGMQQEVVSGAEGVLEQYANRSGLVLPTQPVVDAAAGGTEVADETTTYTHNDITPEEERREPNGPTDPT